MSEFIVHGIPGSPYVRAALLGLEEKQADYRIAPIKFGEQKSPVHLARHPFGRMPVLDHGDFRLYETQAILRYLDRVRPQPQLMPSDPRAAARADQVAGITDWYVFREVSMEITFQRLVAPRYGIPVDEARIGAAIPRAEICIAEVSRLLGQQPYMAGDRLSIGDLMLAPHLVLFAEAPEGRPMLAKHPNLGEWVARMNERPSMVKTTRDRLLDALAA